MPIRISGMNSGLDTDAIVQALVSNVKTKKESYEKKKTKLEWTQDKWKGLNTKIYNLYNKVGNLRWSSSYNLKKTTVSDVTKASVTASNTAIVGTQKLNILSIAQSGYLTGGKLSSKASTKTTLAELGYVGGEGTINIDKGDGTSASVTVSASTTVADFTKALNDQGLNASLDTTNNRLFVSSKQTGVKNDFNLIAGDQNGLAALNSLGLNTSISSGSTTEATYKKYGTYAMTSDGAMITDENVIRNNLLDALSRYKTASNNYSNLSAQIDNVKLAAQSYGSAYSAVQDFYKDYGTGFGNVALMSSSARANTIVDTTSGTEYTKISKTDSEGNAVYSHKDSEGNVSYIKAVEIYKKDDVEYKKNEDGTYETSDGTKYDGDTADLVKEVQYIKADEVITGKVNGDEGAEDAEYTILSRQSETDPSKKEYYFTDSNGDTYVSDSINGEYKFGDETIKFDNVNYNYDSSAYSADETIKSANAIYDEYVDGIAVQIKTEDMTDEEAKAKAASALSTFAGNLTTVNAFEKQSEEEVSAGTDGDAYSKTTLMNQIKDAYANPTDGGSDGVKAKTEELFANLTSLINARKIADQAMQDNSAVASLSELEPDSAAFNSALDKMVESAKMGAVVLSNTDNSAAAVKIDGADAKIKLNGVEYTSDTNNIEVNGITVNAKAVTGDGDSNAITINTQNDAQGIYDKIKEFLSEYNSVINELVKEYNADFVKDFEPLTEDEKDEMSDKEIEKWEEKIKGSLLRHDNTLSGIISTLTTSMMKSVEINGKSFSLSNFGISTLGFLNSAKNEHYAYHIDGDEDDTLTSGKTDKLMAMINEDPDAVVDFFKELSTNLYKTLDGKMKSTDMNSAYTVYSDKQMTKEITSYTKLIKTWESKLADKEDYYYKKFSAMEKAMATLNSTQSSLAGYFQ